MTPFNAKEVAEAHFNELCPGTDGHRWPPGGSMAARTCRACLATALQGARDSRLAEIEALEDLIFDWVAWSGVGHLLDGDDGECPGADDPDSCTCEAAGIEARINAVGDARVARTRPPADPRPAPDMLTARTRPADVSTKRDSIDMKGKP